MDVDGAFVCDEEITLCGFDSWVELFDSSGQTLDQNDDATSTHGQGGSVRIGVDAYLQYTFQTPGTYYVAVGKPGLQPIPAVGENGGGTSYQLHISLGELPYYCLNLPPTIEAKSGRSVKGTQGDDVIVGTQGPDTINGNGGNDIICARDGTNTVKGGDGDDEIYSGSSNDSLSGGDGVDHISGGEGNNQVSGGPGDDVFVAGGDGNDQITGDRGSDVLIGGVATTPSTEV